MKNHTLDSRCVQDNTWAERRRFYVFKVLALPASGMLTVKLTVKLRVLYSVAKEKQITAWAD